MMYRAIVLALCALGLVWQSSAASVAVLPVSDRATDLVGFETNLGNFYVELYGNDSPAHVINFLQYVRDGEYQNSLIHRTVDTSFSVVQGGSFRIPEGSEQISASGVFEVDVRGPVPNEFDASNGLSNIRGSFAAARSFDPDSATSGWYVNRVDDLPFDAPPSGPYTVFGHVVSGMDVIDAIGQLDHVGSNEFDGTQFAAAFLSLPVKPASDFVVVRSVTELAILEGDFDNDGDVDADDFETWSSGFGTGLTQAEGDADLDGDVDGDDFLVWQAKFQGPISGGGGSGVVGLRSSSLPLGTASALAVPEPASAVVLGALLAGFGIVRRRR